MNSQFIKCTTQAIFPTVQNQMEVTLLALHRKPSSTAPNEPSHFVVLFWGYVIKGGKEVAASFECCNYCPKEPGERV